MLAGDISNDGKVNMLDFEMLALQWSASPCDAGNLWCNGTDVDQSGDVGLGDLTDLASDWTDAMCGMMTTSFDLSLDLGLRRLVYRSRRLW